MKNNSINMEKDISVDNRIDNKIIMGVDNLYFKYKRKDDYIIRGASFSIREGMLYGMVGRNSAGKSTLLKLLCGREDNHSGEITLNNHTDLVYLKRNVGIISGEQKLFKDLTVYENGIIHEKTYEGFKIEEYLEYINMYNINRNDRIDMLSASDKIKVKISLVLARHVKVMLLDEPAGVLDVSLREDFMKLLRDITIERNITVIMATHLTEDIDKKADYIIFVNEDGTVELYDREGLNDSYMLLKGSKEALASLPKEAILSYEEKETSVTAMTACFDSIRNKVEELNIVTEIPDISAVMYYKDKEAHGKIKEEAGMAAKGEIQIKRTASKENTYKDIKRIYEGLFSLYGRKWGLAVFSIILCAGWSYGLLTDGMEWYSVMCLVIFVDMFIDIMYEPKTIQIKELYSEIKYLPIRESDVLKYVFSRIAIGAAVLVAITGIICIAGIKSIQADELAATMLVYAIAFIYTIAETSFILKRR